jgi:hypothetical protein
MRASGKLAFLYVVFTFAVLSQAHSDQLGSPLFSSSPNDPSLWQERQRQAEVQSVLNKSRCERDCKAPSYCMLDAEASRMFEINDSYPVAVYKCLEVRPTNGPSSSTCVDASKFLESCRQVNLQAGTECNEESNQGIVNAQTQMAQLSAMAQQAGSVNASCSRVNTVMGVANAALVAFNISCSSAVASCNSACAAAKQYLSSPKCTGFNLQQSIAEVDQHLSACSKFQGQAEAAKTGMQNLMASAGQASKCASQTNGTGIPTPQLCAANPAAPGCVALQNANCSNPQVALTNKICICAKNPSDPQCVTGQSAASGFNGAPSGSIDSSSRMVSATAGIEDIPSLPEIAQGEFKSGGDGGGPVEGQQGGGSPVGSGSGIGGGGAGGGGSESSGKADGHQVVSGFYGGTNSPGSGSYSGSNYGGGGGYRSFGSPAEGSGSSGGPDLRKFLPGRPYDPRRGISGASGPDGITGPNSDIWMKVKNRYQVMGTTLLP